MFNNDSVCFCVESRPSLFAVLTLWHHVFVCVQGRVLSSGMDDGQEQDHYEERLRDVFNSFDASGSGSLNPEELSDLCQSLQLGDATPALLHTLLQNQDHLTARVSLQLYNSLSYLSVVLVSCKTVVKYCSRG